MRFVVLYIRAVDALNGALGRVLALGLLAAASVCFLSVVLRYGFGIAFAWMQDSYVWLNAAGFTLGAAFTLKTDAHVRVDVFYRPAPPRRKAWIELAGTLLFLLPTLAVIAFYTYPAVRLSWIYGEGSQNVGGLPGLYLLKACVLGFCATMALQALAQAGRAALLLAGHPEHARHLSRGGGTH